MKMRVNMAWEIRSPKSEIRKKPEIRIPKRLSATRTRLFELRISSFGFLSDFGFRISDFSFSFQHQVKQEHHAEREQQRVMLEISGLQQSERAASEVRAAPHQTNPKPLHDPAVNPGRHRRDEIVRADE